MYFHEHTCDTPVENLAWDEAVLEGAEQMEGSEALRVWEMPRACVVVGRASRVDDEVFVERCSRDNVPILRRMSGGSAIVAGPGCLMYSALLSLEERPECRNVDAAHRTVMERTREAVQSALQHHRIDGQIAVEGICDLTWNGSKISGNALRVKRHWLMYHGTILLSMPLEWISQYLKNPPRQPEYRERRPHDRFVTNLRLTVEQVPTFKADLAQELAHAWDARLAWADHPLASSTTALTREWLDRRYSDPAWHGQRGG
jgi:lipoate-protein ligase A